MNLFLDTSALVKLFYKEKGSQQIELLVNDTGNTIWISELSRIEFFSALFRKYRERLLTDAELEQAVNGFEEQLHFFSLEPISILIFNECALLIRKHGKSDSLRTLDAIQLAAFLTIAESDWQFVLADEKLEKVAGSIGIKTMLIK